MGSINDTQDSIKGEWSILQSEWDNTRSLWRDSVANRFEKQFWSELERQIPQLLSAMEELDEILDQALYNTED
jgi:hypothetical protein